MSGIPLDGVETEIVKQGLAFLFAQGGEVLKRRRAAKDAASRPQGDASADVDVTLPPLEPPEGVFVPASLDVAPRTARLADGTSRDLALARSDVEDYVTGDAHVDLTSRSTLDAVLRLRDLLADIYGTSLQFRGEHPQPTTINVTDQRNYGVHVESGGKIKARNVTGTKGPIRD